MRGGLHSISETATHQVTAHIPGGGPDGRTCAERAHLDPTTKGTRGRCRKALEMHRMLHRMSEAERASNPDWWRGLPAIEASTAACKYFEVNKTKEAKRLARLEREAKIKARQLRRKAKGTVKV